MAARLFIATVGTEFLPVGKEPGFFKLAYQRPDFVQRLDVAAIPAQIALRQRMLAEGGRDTQVEYQIESFC